MPATGTTYSGRAVIGDKVHVCHRNKKERGVEDMSYLFSKVGYDDAGIYHTEGVYCKSYDTFNDDISAWDGAFWILYVFPPPFFFLLSFFFWNSTVT